MPEPASYIDPFAALFQEMKKGVLFNHEATSFFALVTSFAAGPPKTAIVQRIGAPNTEGPYRVSNHLLSLQAGDRVYVADITGEGGFAIILHLPVNPATETPPPTPPVVIPGMYLIGNDSGNERTALTTTLTDLSVFTVDLAGAPLSIGVEVPLEIWIPYRKTAGAADSIAVGLLVNGVQVNAGRIVTGTTNAADDGLMIIEIAPRLANYQHAIAARFTSQTLAGASAYYATTNPMPVAPITDLRIQGKIGATSGLGGYQMFTQDIRIWGRPIA